MSVLLSAAGAALSAPPATDILAHIGNTPLLRLKRITRDLPGIEIYGKAEYFNPGGSVKGPTRSAEHDSGRRAHGQAETRRDHT